MKSRAGIRSTYSPRTTRLIGWLSRWPYKLCISSAHNEKCPAALTLGFNQNVAHCLKDKGSLTKSVTEPTWPERRCVALHYLQLWTCPFCCSQYSLQSQSILFYESDKKKWGKLERTLILSWFTGIFWKTARLRKITSRSHCSFPPPSMPPHTSWLESPRDTKTPTPHPHPSHPGWASGSWPFRAIHWVTNLQSSVHPSSQHMLIYLLIFYSSLKKSLNEPPQRTQPGQQEPATLCSATFIKPAE